MIKKMVGIFFLLQLNLCMGMYIGSDNRVEAFSEQQILDNGDIIARFAALEGGFALRRTLASATFNSFFPILGGVELNGGTLILGHDLVIQAPGSLKSLGTIIGNSHQVQINADLKAIPEVLSSQLECKLLLVLQTMEVASINSCDWTDDDQFFVIGLGANGTAVVKVYQFDGQNLINSGTSLLSGQQVNVVRFHPADNFIAVGTVNNVSGAELYIFEFDHANKTITLVDSKEIGATINSLTWHQVHGDFLAIGTDAAGSEIQLFSFDQTTKQLSNSARISIALSPHRAVQPEAMDWSFTSSFLFAGVELVGDNPTLFAYEFNSTLTTLTLNASINTERTVRTLESNPRIDNFLAVGLQGLSGELLQVYEHNGIAGTFTKKASADNVLGTVRVLDWSRITGRCIAVGCDQLLAGHLATYFFDPNSAVLTSVVSSHLSDPIDGLRWSHAGEYVVVGNNNGIVSFFRSAKDFFAHEFVNFENVNLIFTHDVVLHDILIRIKGDVGIIGRGITLTVGSDTIIEIDSHSGLLLKDITIKGLAENNVRCVDHSATLTLQNTQLILDSDYSFTVGHFEIVDACAISGENYVFDYTSSQTSTILSQSSLRLLSGITFKYNPMSAVSNLIQFTDETSKLIFDNAYLYSIPTLQFTKGTIQVIESSLFETDQVIIFGNGEASYDCTCMINRDALLKLTRGTIVYNNVLPDSWNMASNRSRLSIASGGQLRILQDLILGDGIIEFAANTTLARVIGKKITGAIHALGNVSLVRLG